MTFLYMWIIFCVGFISGATWTGLFRFKDAVDTITQAQTLGGESDLPVVNKSHYDARTGSRNTWQKTIKTIATIPI